MTSVQPQYKDYSPDAGASLSSQLNAGKALAPSDFHRMQAISEFSDYPGAAMLRTKELNGETLTPGSRMLLSALQSFPRTLLRPDFHPETELGLPRLPNASYYSSIVTA